MQTKQINFLSLSAINKIQEVLIKDSSVFLELNPKIKKELEKEYNKGFVSLKECLNIVIKGTDILKVEVPYETTVDIDNFAKWIEETVNQAYYPHDKFKIQYQTVTTNCKDLIEDQANFYFKILF
jgi:hypothetical protein